MNAHDRKDVVVVGAGISGLATAQRLHKAGLDVLVLEKAARVGGAIQTEIEDGFLIDYGPNSSLETSPKIQQFIRELGLQDEKVIANSQANRRYILRNGQLVPLPMNPPQFLRSKLFSTRAKLRLLREPFISPPAPDREETIAEFVERRLGREFLDYAINPFIAGVYAGDPSRLSVRSAVAKIYALEKNYGSLIKGAIKGARERKKRPDVDKTKARLFSFKHGMSQLIDALTSGLGQRVVMQASIESIRIHEGYDVGFSAPDGNRYLKARSLVFTTPADVTASYLKPFDDELAARLAEIVYPPVAVVFLGFKRNVPCRPLDGFGFLVPKIEGRRILGTIWSSTLFPNRAPAEGMALTTFVGGMRQPEVVDRDDSELQTLVLQELQQIMGLNGQPDIVRIKRWPRAIPQYELGHKARMDAVAAFEAAHPGLIISGNFRNGISVSDCILQSEKVAERVREFCEKRSTSNKSSVKPELNHVQTTD